MVPKAGAGPSWGTQLLCNIVLWGNRMSTFFFSFSSAKRWRSIAMNLLTGWASTKEGAAETVWKRQLFACRSSHRELLKELFKVPCLHKTTHSETSSCSRGQWSTKNLPDTPRGGGRGGRLLHIVYNSEYNSTTVQECRFEDFSPSGSIVSVAVALNRHIVRAWRTIMSLCSKHSDLWPSQ